MNNKFHFLTELTVITTLIITNIGCETKPKEEAYRDEVRALQMNLNKYVVLNHLDFNVTDSGANIFAGIGSIWIMSDKGGSELGLLTAAIDEFARKNKFNSINCSMLYENVMLVFNTDMMYKLESLKRSGGLSDSKITEWMNNNITFHYQNVKQNSLYREDMSVLGSMINAEYSGTEVACVKVEGFVCLTVHRNQLWNTCTGEESHYIMSCIADFTEKTAWHSDECYVYYHDMTVGYTTKGARYYKRKSDYWSTQQTANWITKNVSFIRP